MNNLVRTQILLEESQKATLDLLSASRAQSMGDLVRRAVESYLKTNKPMVADRRALIKSLAGSLANSPNWKNIDASRWQRELRREKGI